jgi:hypothetical protein
MSGDVAGQIADSGRDRSVKNDPDVRRAVKKKIALGTALALIGFVLALPGLRRTASCQHGSA